MRSTFSQTQTNPGQHKTLARSRNFQEASPPCSFLMKAKKEKSLQKFQNVSFKKSNQTVSITAAFFSLTIIFQMTKKMTKKQKRRAMTQIFYFTQQQMIICISISNTVKAGSKNRSAFIKRNRTKVKAHRTHFYLRIETTTVIESFQTAV